MDFVHLKAQSEYSITQGSNRIDELVEKVAKNNMGAIGIADKNGLFGAVSFYSAARKKGLKPIMALDTTILQEDGNTYQLTLIAKNDNGYKNLIALNSRGYTENRSANSVALKEEWLADLQDIIVLSGAKHGLIGQSILKDDYSTAKLVAEQMKEVFGDNFYIELQRDGTKEEDKYMEGAVQLCSELNIAPVATHPALFANPDDFVAHEARYCIAHKQPLFSMKRERPFNKEMYVKTKEEMAELFSDLPEALENTVAIAKKCNVKIDLGNEQLPKFTTPNGEPTDSYFANFARQGLEERLIENFPDIEEREAKRKEYEERLNWEIETITNMKFPEYFLIVADFINWAKEQDIPVGPGRGSGAGSLVAYAMKITDLDPLPYNLYFERFLNPERVSMPDFDIDFCQERREEVIDYVRQKYGENAVCQIGTFGTMAARSVVKDVGRTLGYHYEFFDGITKMINIKPAAPITLKQFIFGDEEKGIMQDDALLERYNNEMDVKKLIDIALRLEGLTRQIGKGAAGVVISPTLLTDFTPLYTTEPNGIAQTQFDKNDVEKAGLVKFDFLGLTNLTIIKEAVDLINQHAKSRNESEFLLNKIPLNDELVYKNTFWNGNTVGVFQFESKGMTSTLQKAKPEVLEDLMAVTAIYRPGPMEIISQWFESRTLPEEDRTYPHELLRDTLKETAGFMIYQEQVMKCAQVIAGYSLGGADMLRRAMGKKKPEEMAKERHKFVEGAAKNDIDSDKANEIFNLMEKFAGYGFNKSHAAAYAYISYQTAYLKTYYPQEFYTANLNAQMDDTDKLAILIGDAKKNKLDILAPNINLSYKNFSITENGEIRYGLEALKGVGGKAVDAIVYERETNGPFLDFYDFLERVGKRSVKGAYKGAFNKRVIEALINSGALDGINENRAQLKESLPVALDYLTKYKKRTTDEVSVLGDSLFEEDDLPVVPVKTRKKKELAPLIRPTLIEAEEWNELERAKNEKKVLGFFFTSNPFETYYSKHLDGFQTALSLAKLNSFQPEDEEQYITQAESIGEVEIFKDDIPSEVFVGGIVEDIYWWKSKKGATVTISDGTSTTSVMMFSDFLIDNKEWFKNDAFVALRLKIQTKYDQVEDKEVLNFSVMQAFDFEQTKKLTTNKIFVGCENNPDLLNTFDKVCNDYVSLQEDNDPVIVLCVDDPKTGRKTKQVKKLFIKPESKLLEDLIKTFGDSWVKVLYKKNVDNLVFPALPKRKGNNNNNNKKFKKAFSN